MPPVGWKRADDVIDSFTKPVSNGLGSSPQGKLGMLFPEERGMSDRQAKAKLT